MTLMRLFALLLGLVWCIGSAHAAEERRVALIIGNDAYRNLPKLSNAANDSRAMAAELKAAGFETTVKVNAGRREMLAAINEFSGRLSAGAVGLFYYAGHGIQAKDRNFLIPVDAQMDTEDDLEADGVEAGKVLRGMEEAHNRLNIVVLDACRDNPLPKGRSASRGLAVMPAPTGTFVAYATGPGQIAQDGDKGANGVFTGELVKALRQPGLSIEQVFKTAAGGVRERTGGKQVPWIQASIQGDFYFRPPIGGAVAQAPVVSGGGTDKETVFWLSIQNSSRASDYQAYLDKYPNGDFVALARSRLDELKGTKTASLMPPRSEPVLEALDREMVAGRKASMRDAPEAKAKLISTLSEGDSIQVTGKVKGENWYAVSRKGQHGYVVSDTLEEPSAYKSRKDKEAQAVRSANRLQQDIALYFDEILHTLQWDSGIYNSIKPVAGRAIDKAPYGYLKNDYDDQVKYNDDGQGVLDSVVAYILTFNYGEFGIVVEYLKKLTNSLSQAGEVRKKAEASAAKGDWNSAMLLAVEQMKHLAHAMDNGLRAKIYLEQNNAQKRRK